MAELADAHGSGPCTRKGVGVRVPSSAPYEFKKAPDFPELSYPLLLSSLFFTSHHQTLAPLPDVLNRQQRFVVRPLGIRRDMPAGNSRHVRDHIRPGTIGFALR